MKKKKVLIRLGDVIGYYDCCPATVHGRAEDYTTGLVIKTIRGPNKADRGVILKYPTIWNKLGNNRQVTIVRRYLKGEYFDADEKKRVWMTIKYYKLKDRQSSDYHTLGAEYRKRQRNCYFGMKKEFETDIAEYWSNINLNMPNDNEIHKLGTINSITPNVNEMYMLGTIVVKYFVEVDRRYTGIVIHYNEKTKWYKILFSDGKMADFDESEMKEHRMKTQVFHNTKEESFFMGNKFL